MLTWVTSDYILHNSTVTIGKVSLLGHSHKREDEPGNHQDHQKSAEHSTASREVDLSLKGEESEPQGNSTCDPNRDEDGIRVESGTQGTQHESLSRCEDAQENEVGRELSADSFTANHADQANDHDGKCYPVKASRLLGIFTQWLVEGENADDSPR